MSSKMAFFGENFPEKTHRVPPMCSKENPLGDRRSAPGLGESLAEWRGTQGYFEKLNKVYLGWHFGLKKNFGGSFSGRKNFLGVYSGENFF